MLNGLFTQMYAEAAEMNRRNILSLASDAPAGGRLLDLGCDDGGWTTRLAASAGAGEMHGVELVEEAAAKAARAGVRVSKFDLNARMDGLASDAFDLVHANQVIEHVTNVDLFVSEVFRLLRPGGYAIVSTENASSWHNVFAAAMGWQIFSLSNVSERRSGLGNPFALHRGKPPYTGTWTHKTIFSYRGLLEMFEAHGFVELTIAGAGYFPLPSFLGRLDPRHAPFITIRGRKPFH